VKVAIIGGGTMGVGIAHRFALMGALTNVVDVDLATAKLAVARTEATLQTAVERNKVVAEQADAAILRLSAVASMAELARDLDLIVESVVEDPALKSMVLTGAEKRNPTVLASNTSSISIDSLASGLSRPERFVGMHFFNPVWSMPLVEVIRGEATSAETLDKVASIVDFLGMEQAVVNNAPGFTTTRLGVLVGLEAIRMVEEGVAAPKDIDRAMSLGYGHPMGPLMLGDLVGLDVRLKIADHLSTVYGDRFAAPELLRKMVDEGRLGKKSGAGFYDWSKGSAEPFEER